MGVYPLGGNAARGGDLSRGNSAPPRACDAALGSPSVGEASPRYVPLVYTEGRSVAGPGYWLGAEGVEPISPHHHPLLAASVGRSRFLRTEPRAQGVLRVSSPLPKRYSGP